MQHPRKKTSLPEVRATVLIVQGHTRLVSAFAESNLRVLVAESMARAANDLASRRLQPDVILVQSDLVSLDALTAFQQISEANVGGAPILFLGSAADRKKLLEVMWLGGLFDFVTEPFDAADLLHRVRRAIQQHQRNRKRARPEPLTSESQEMIGSRNSQALLVPMATEPARERLRALL